MVCVPTVRVDVVNAAEPATSGTIPSVVPPSRKVTLPLGVPALESTVAVKVTLTPTFAVLEEENKPLVVPAGFTTSETCAVAVESSVPSVGVNVTDKLCEPALKIVPVAGLYTNVPATVVEASS